MKQLSFGETILKFFGFFVVSLPFLLTAWMFIWANKTGLIRETGFWAGVLITISLVGLFVGNKWIKQSKRGGYWYKAHWENSMLLSALLLGSIVLSKVYSWDPFFQAFYIPVLPISFSILFLKGFYQDRLYFFKNIPKKRPRKKKNHITITKKGDDNPWFGGMPYIEEHPVEKTFIRGFNEDMRKLSDIIMKITGKHSLLFYALYEPKKGVFDEVIKYAQENGMYHQLMKSYEGVSLAVSSRDTKNLEKLLSRFWVEEYICWIVAHDSSITNMAEKMHKTFNTFSFSLILCLYSVL